MGQTNVVNLKKIGGACRKHCDFKSEDTAIPELAGGN
jgi:hypothetical protein